MTQDEGYTYNYKPRTKLAEICLGCKRSDVHLISISDHPDCRDGLYCESCNPYEVDSQADEARIKRATDKVLDEVLEQARLESEATGARVCLGVDIEQLKLIIQKVRAK